VALAGGMETRPALVARAAAAWVAKDACKVADVADGSARVAEAAAWAAVLATNPEEELTRAAEDAGTAADKASWNAIARATLAAINAECDAQEVDR